MFVYLLKTFLHCSLAAYYRRSHRSRWLPIFALSLRFPYQLGHLSHEHLSRVLHPCEGKEGKTSSTRGIRPTRTPVKLASRLPDTILQLCMWSIIAWCCRQMHWRAHKHTCSPSYNHLYSLITLTRLFMCPLMPARKMSCISIVPLGCVCH